MGYRGLSVMGERPGGEPGTSQRIRRSWPRRMSGIISVGAAALDVGLDAFNMQLDNGGFAFVAQQEFQALQAVLIKSF